MKINTFFKSLLPITLAINLWGMVKPFLIDRRRDKVERDADFHQEQKYVNAFTAPEAASASSRVVVADSTLPIQIMQKVESDLMLPIQIVANSI